MKRIHPEDPRITQHALGELSHAEAREIEHAALLDPAVQSALDETRQMAGLLDEVMGQGELALGEDRLKAIRSAGRSGNVVSLESANPRKRWGRVAMVGSIAAGLMLATIVILQQIPVEGQGRQGGTAPHEAVEVRPMSAGVGPVQVVQQAERVTYRNVPPQL